MKGIGLVALLVAGIALGAHAIDVDDITDVSGGWTCDTFLQANVGWLNSPVILIEGQAPASDGFKAGDTVWIDMAYGYRLQCLGERVWVRHRLYFPVDAEGRFWGVLDDYEVSVTPLGNDCSIDVRIYGIGWEDLNQAPRFVNWVPSYTAKNEGWFEFSFFAVDPDGDDLEFHAYSPSTIGFSGTVWSDEGEGEGYCDLQMNGAGTYPVFVSVSDGTHTVRQVVTIEVVAVGSPPVAGDDVVSVNEDESVKIRMLDNDSDPDGDGIGFGGIVEHPSHGTVKLNAWVDLSLTYTPNPGFHGTDTFQYRVMAEDGAHDTGTVTITVLSVEDPPSATDDNFELPEDSSLVMAVMSNDADQDGDEIEIVSWTQPVGGVVTEEAEGVLLFRPEQDYCGHTSFSYTIEDSDGDNATATVSLHVTCVNDLPQALDDTSEVAAGEEVLVDVLGNDRDGAGENPFGLHIRSVEDPALGSVVVMEGNYLKYRAEGICGSKNDSFEYTIADEEGETSTAKVTITIHAEAPEARNDEARTRQGENVEVEVLTNDSIPGGAEAAISCARRPIHGSCVVEGEVIIYTPDSNWHGRDTFRYSITDERGCSSSALVIVTVEPNREPIAVDDSAEVNQGRWLYISVLGNDRDSDGDTLTIDSVSRPNYGGTVRIRGDRIYYKPLSVVGNTAEVFTYSISDEYGGTDTATVSVWIEAVNHNPMARSDRGSVRAGRTVRIRVLRNDYDQDGDRIEVDRAYLSPLSRGMGTVTYGWDWVSFRADSSASGTAYITYKIEDEQGGVATGTISITITGSSSSSSSSSSGAAGMSRWYRWIYLR